MFFFLLRLSIGSLIEFQVGSTDRVCRLVLSAIILRFPGRTTNFLSISPILLLFARASRRSRRICMRSHAASNWRRGLGNPPPFVPTNVWMQGAWSTPLSCRCNEPRTGILTLNLDLNLHLRYLPFYASWWDVRMELLHPFFARAKCVCTPQGALDRFFKNLTDLIFHKNFTFFQKSQQVTRLLHQRPLEIVLKINFDYPPAVTKYNFRKALHFIVQEPYLHVIKNRPVRN